MLTGLIIEKSIEWMTRPQVLVMQSLKHERNYFNISIHCGSATNFTGQHAAPAIDNKTLSKLFSLKLFRYLTYAVSILFAVSILYGHFNELRKYRSSDRNSLDSFAFAYEGSSWKVLPLNFLLISCTISWKLVYWNHEYANV